MPDDPTFPSNPDDDALARLADGTLAEPRAGELRARVADSPELQARLREQQRAVSLMQATQDVVAPASLRASLDGLTARPERGAARSRSRSARRWRPRLAAPALALAVALAALVVVLATGGQATPTVHETARLALASATSPAPSRDPHNGNVLTVHASGIAFPSYVADTRWRASGLRSDTLRGRRVTTVFYRGSSGQRIGYSIVGGRALAVPNGSSESIGGVRYVSATDGAARLITWRRDGHTCVIAGRSVSPGTLLRLAAADEQTA